MGSNPPFIPPSSGARSNIPGGQPASNPDLNPPKRAGDSPSGPSNIKEKRDLPTTPIDTRDIDIENQEQLKKNYQEIIQFKKTNPNNRTESAKNLITRINFQSTWIDLLKENNNNNNDNEKALFLSFFQDNLKELVIDDATIRKLATSFFVYVKTEDFQENQVLDFIITKVLSRNNKHLTNFSDYISTVFQREDKKIAFLKSLSVESIALLGGVNSSLEKIINLNLPSKNIFNKIEEAFKAVIDLFFKKETLYSITENYLQKKWLKSGILQSKLNDILSKKISLQYTESHKTLEIRKFLLDTTQLYIQKKLPLEALEALIGKLNTYEASLMGEKPDPITVQNQVALKYSLPVIGSLLNNIEQSSLYDSYDKSNINNLKSLQSSIAQEFAKNLKKSQGASILGRTVTVEDILSFYTEDIEEEPDNQETLNYKNFIINSFQHLNEKQSVHLIYSYFFKLKNQKQLKSQDIEILNLIKSKIENGTIKISDPNNNSNVKISILKIIDFYTSTQKQEDEISPEPKIFSVNDELLNLDNLLKNKKILGKDFLAYKLNPVNDKEYLKLARKLTITKSWITKPNKTYIRYKILQGIKQGKISLTTFNKKDGLNDLLIKDYEQNLKNNPQIARNDIKILTAIYREAQKKQLITENTIIRTTSDLYQPETNKETNFQTLLDSAFPELSEMFSYDEENQKGIISEDHINNIFEDIKNSKQDQITPTKENQDTNQIGIHLVSDVQHKAIENINTIIETFKKDNPKTHFEEPNIQQQTSKKIFGMPRDVIENVIRTAIKNPNHEKYSKAPQIFWKIAAKILNVDISDLTRKNGENDNTLALEDTEEQKSKKLQATYNSLIMYRNFIEKFPEILTQTITASNRKEIQDKILAETGLLAHPELVENTEQFPFFYMTAVKLSFYTLFNLFKELSNENNTDLKTEFFKLMHDSTAACLDARIEELIEFQLTHLTPQIDSTINTDSNTSSQFLSFKIGNTIPESYEKFIESSTTAELIQAFDALPSQTEQDFRDLINKHKESIYKNCDDTEKTQLDAFFEQLIQEANDDTSMILMWG